MAISKKTIDALGDLAARMVAEDEPGGASIRNTSFTDRRISPQLLPADADFTNLTVTGADYWAFDETLNLLAAEQELEHLTEREIDASLWDFCCELFLDRDRYQAKPKRDQRVNQYVQNIAKPHLTFEIVVVLENATIESAFTIDDVRFEHWGEQDVSGWRFFENDMSHEFENQPVAIATVKAGHIDKAVTRAHMRIDEALDILTYGYRASIYLRVHDEELMIRRGDRQLVRSEDGSRWQRWRIQRPAPMRLNRQSIDRTLAYVQTLETLLARRDLRKDFKKRLRLALHWLRSAAAKWDHDEKVIDLCTALESLFCTKNDRWKGELIALRSLLLQFAADGSFADTFSLLRTYELRSSLVHGSALGITGDAHCRLLIGNILRLMRIQLEYLSSHPELTSFSKFAESIETPDNLTVALQWFDQFGKGAERVVQVAKTMGIR